MQILRMIWFRLRALIDRDAVNSELDDELRFHVERETAENVKRGMSATDARRTALAEFGGVERFKEYTRDERQTRWLDDVGSDIKHGVRLLHANKLFSTAVILTLALGIGATSTIFAIVNGVLLRKFPYPNASRIVSITESTKGEDGGRAGQHAYRVWSESARSYSALAVYSPTSGVLTGQGEPTDIEGIEASASFFSVFSFGAALGRTFTSAENQSGAPRVIVLSHALWQNTFGGDTGILRRSVTLNGNAFQVIGVMPASFGAPWHALYWLPIRIPNSPNAEYSSDVIGRLKDGVEPSTALAELQQLSARVDSLRSRNRGGRQPVQLSLHERTFGSVAKPLTILMSAVFVMLLVACANVANLSLARSASRQREFAVRTALGAGRWRLVRQLLVESSLLSLIGGALGAALPMLLIGVFVKLSPTSVAGVSDIKVDGTVLAFTAAVTIIVALLFGLAPALAGARRGSSVSLAGGSARAGNARAHHTIRSVLIVFEVSAALVLLTGAGLITKSFARVLSVNPGFTPENVFTANIYLPRKRYPETPNVASFYATLAERVRALPGVHSVSASGTAPLSGPSMTAEIARSADDPTKLTIGFAEVDGEFGKAAGLALVEGRFINASDVVGTPQVAMITAAAAQHFFPGQSAVGRTLPAMSAYGDSGQRQVVVGVVRDVAQRSLDVAPVPQVFVAGAQHNMYPQHLIIRTSIDEETLRTTLKRFIRNIDPLQPLTEFSSVQEAVAKSVAPRRFNSILVNSFAGLALLLSMIGLYGLMAHAVSSRTRELGIRIALGAQSGRVLQLVLRQGAWLLLTGVVVGAALSLALSKGIASLLYGVPAQDPVIFVGAPVLLAVVGMLACYVPARRATMVNPIAALRQD
ncbi:MAG: ABC transporter permease [Phycisphaerae bacterium]|nr:ABC transporter permease [Gemmatimonadaceae bacterium]